MLTAARSNIADAPDETERLVRCTRAYKLWQALELVQGDRLKDPFFRAFVESVLASDKTTSALGTQPN